MKKFAFLILLTAVICFAQQDVAEKIDIRSIVQRQIDEAKKRDSLKQSYTENTVKEEQPAMVVKNASIANVKQSELGISYEVVILLASSIIIFSSVFVRRKVKKSKAPQKKLKKNISLMREEKFIKKIDPKLKRIRTNLCLNSRYLNEQDENLTVTAKKFQIAKGEILLASRLNDQLVNQNLSRS